MGLRLCRLERMKPSTRDVRFMFDTINLRGSVLEKEPRTEQELRKYQGQEKDHGLEYGSITIVLKPLKDNQGFRTKIVRKYHDKNLLRYNIGRIYYNN